MTPISDPASISQGIQYAIAPVFLLTAVASLIGAVANRLARIIDRARHIEERLEAESVKDVAAAYRELNRLRLRGRLVNGSITLLTICGTMIGLTIVALFLAETTAIRSNWAVPASFLAGIISFVLALLGFLAETFLASDVVRFGRHLQQQPAGASGRKCAPD